MQLKRLNWKIDTRTMKDKFISELQITENYRKSDVSENMLDIG